MKSVLETEMLILNNTWVGSVFTYVFAFMCYVYLLWHWSEQFYGNFDPKAVFALFKEKKPCKRCSLAPNPSAMSVMTSTYSVEYGVLITVHWTEHPISRGHFTLDNSPKDTHSSTVPWVQCVTKVLICIVLPCAISCYAVQRHVESPQTLFLWVSLSSCIISSDIDSE